MPVPPLAGAKAPLQPKLKVLLAIEPVTLVSLMTKPTRVEPKVEEAVPPLLTPRIPVTSLPAKLIAPTLSSPPADLTGPVAKDDRLVEPTALILKKAAPEVEATAKIGIVWAAEVATTYRLAPAGVEVLMIKAFAVLSQRKLVEPAVVEAPV